MSLLNRNFNRTHKIFIALILIGIALFPIIKIKKNTEETHVAVIRFADNAALRFAASKGDFEEVKFQINAGANINTYESLPLRWASFNGDTRMVEFLLRSGADFHALNNQALRYAGTQGHVDVMKLLLAAGANSRAFSEGELKNLDKSAMEVLQEAINGDH